jgi:hypothetical protein
VSNAHRFLIVVLCLTLSSGAALYQAQTAPDLVATTEAFLASLSPEQADKVRFRFDDEERFNWHFIPRERLGLPLKEMEPQQQSLAHAMMAAVLGFKGMIKATTIMSLEPVLAELEGPGRQFSRDPQLYYFSVFGEPSDVGAWGWRLEGHHVAVNITVDDGRIVAASPSMLGSNPAEVREGPRRGLRALGAEEDLARKLLESFNAAQREVVMIDEKPRDIVTGAERKAMIEGQDGLLVSAMTDVQREMVWAIIREYVDRMAPSTAAKAIDEIQNAGLDAIRFVWAGSLDRGEAHYYRLHGPTFVVEYDNSQNNANHIHSVFRNFEGDFGVDMLAAHYEAYPHEAFAD